MIDPKIALAYYSRPEIQEAIVEQAKNKEAVGSVQGEAYRRRPDILQYPGDVFELAKQGVTSFHSSEELWHNPLLLKPGMSKKDFDENRKGWDLLLDIDCPELQFSGIAGYFLVEALKYHGIKSIFVKFSGNHGFHIAVPFEAFPDKIRDKETRTLFPEAPQVIAAYLKGFISKHLRDKILDKFDIPTIARLSKKNESEIFVNGIFDPFAVLSIDTILISPRHLYRMPYSFNEKSGLVSLPIEPEGIITFSKEQATHDKINPSRKFMVRENIECEARELILKAYDKDADRPIVISGIETTHTKRRNLEEDKNALPESYFPPCINKLLLGLQDGKKRSQFILMNYLRCINWSDDKIEELTIAWNKKNPEPIRDTILLGQIKHFRQKKEKIPPPNCANKEHYADIGICVPDNYCSRIKNPVQYSKRKAYIANKAKQEAEKPKIVRPKLTEEQKEARKKYREQVKEKKE